jgi:hypothetical protein
VAHRLNLPLAPVLPLRLCAVPGALYAALMGYKESPVDEARQRFACIVAAHFAASFSVHASCLMASLGGEADIVLPVPSTSRPGGASLEMVGGLGDLAVRALGHRARWLPALLRRAAAPVGHMRPHAEAFAPTGRAAVKGARVVLLDDTYVSGARAQSAAAALRHAGARATLIVPLGRILRPDRLAAHAAYLARARQHDTRADRCCRCVLPQRAAGMA